MRSSTLSAMAFALTSKVLASPLAGHGGVEGRAPASTTSRGTTDGIIDVPLTDWIKNGNTDLQWYTTISVGNPPQNFTVLVDTGSRVLLLPQSNCTSCSAAQSKFDPALSSTFAWSPLGAVEPGFSTGGDTVPLAAPQGARCNMAADDVAIGGATAPSLAFALCWDEGPAMTSQPGIDGILGLGIAPPGGDGGLPSLQWALRAAGALGSGTFGLYTPPGDVGGGRLTLGGVDEARFEGDLVWLPLDLAGHTTWTVDMQTVFVDGRQLMVPGAGDGGDNNNDNNNGSSAAATAPSPYPRSLVQVLDSGTSFLMAPDNATAAALYAQVSPVIRQIDPVVGTWGCACDDMDALVESGAAELTFLLGPDDEPSSSSSSSSPQLNVTVPSRVFNLGPYPGLPGVCQAVVNNWTGDGAHYEGMGLWVLGSPLLKNYYTAWDGLGLRVGWAPLKGAVGEATTTVSATATAVPTSHGRPCA